MGIITIQWGGTLSTVFLATRRGGFGHCSINENSSTTGYERRISLTILDDLRPDFLLFSDDRTMIIKHGVLEYVYLQTNIRHIQRLDGQPPEKLDCEIRK